MTTGAKDQLIFIGTYTRGGESRGIYSYRMDGRTGALKALSSTSGLTNPSFVCLDPTNRYLYAVSEVESNDGVPGGAASSFRVDLGTGRLEHINTQSTKGPGPCHVTIDATGTIAIVSNYGGGSVAVFPIASDGSLEEASQFIQHEGHSGVNERRQAGPHAHSATIDHQNRFVYIADLGKDKVMIYELDHAGRRIKPASTPWVETAPGAGPRHFDFHPNRKFAYVINELGNTITLYSYDGASGLLAEQQTVPSLPADFDGQNTTADIHVHPNGRFVYGSNRGHDSLAIYAVNEADGRMTYVGHQSTGGKTPRNFAIDPSGTFLFAENQNSDTIVTFRIDAETGKLSEAGQVTQVPAAVCVKFAPAG
jgi:6-phosphogluconolactonase